MCRVIDGRAFFILALRLPKWARKKMGNYNDEAEVLTAFVYCSEQVGLKIEHVSQSEGLSKSLQGEFLISYLLL